jgi:predicted HNH restriction endonuclease
MAQHDKEKETIVSGPDPVTTNSGVDDELLAEVAANKERKQRKDYYREYKQGKREQDPDFVARERLYSRTYAAGNKDKMVAYNKERYKQHKLRAVEYMGGVCMDCKGAFHIAAFDFHHIDPREPDLIPSWLSRSWANIEAELSKCVMLCANCHRIRHHETDE